MWYAIVGTDVPDSLPLRQSAREAHLARLQALRDAGRLLLAGPFPAVDAADPGPAGFTGSLIVPSSPTLKRPEPGRRRILTGQRASMRTSPCAHSRRCCHDPRGTGIRGKKG